MCVSFDTALPLDATVHAHTRGFEGQAEVRYCQGTDAGYQIGLEFVDGAGWDRDQWRPRHLVDKELTKAMAERGRV